MRVEYWSISLVHPGRRSPRLFSCLSPDEQVRAQGFKFPELQQRFVLARGGLRQILGFYLGQAPQAITFEYGAQGKPRLPGLAFNLAHTKQLAFYAIALDQPHANIGVDIELKDRDSDVLPLAKRFFTAAEYEFLRQLPPESRRSPFLRLWTAKEAYLKGTGLGLQGGLDSVTIRLLPTPKLINQALERWSLRLFEPDQVHLGAIAIDQPDCQFTDCGEWML